MTPMTEQGRLLADPRKRYIVYPFAFTYRNDTLKLTLVSIAKTETFMVQQQAYTNKNLQDAKTLTHLISQDSVLLPFVIAQLDRVCL